MTISLVEQVKNTTTTSIVSYPRKTRQPLDNVLPYAHKMSDYTANYQTTTRNRNNLQDCSPIKTIQPQTLKTEKVEIDRDLDPRNAGEKGYQWVKDTICTPKAPVIFQAIIRLINEGYRLGQPNLTNASKILVGLYKPKV